ncbi:MAG: hypothetical protein HGA80_01010 [Candidatus Omnitrophica bacterium]|nr:hypothetical protein [Candidatus Omnitrophota bacterium]
MLRKRVGLLFLWSAVVFAGCTVKAVGDPNRPITINAHITIDINGLQKTATGIEDMVSGAAAAK